MFTVFLVLIIIISIFLILAVLVQNSKGGGLAANFTSAQVMGVRKTADMLEKGTWIMAGSLVFLCILSTVVISKSSETEAKKSIIQEQLNTTPEQNMPVMPNATVPTDSTKPK